MYHWIVMWTFFTFDSLRDTHFCKHFWEDCHSTVTGGGDHFYVSVSPKNWFLSWQEKKKACTKCTQETHQPTEGRRSCQWPLHQYDSLTVKILLAVWWDWIQSLGTVLTSKGNTYMNTKEWVKPVLISVKNSFTGVHKTFQVCWKSCQGIV